MGKLGLDTSKTNRSISTTSRRELDFVVFKNNARLQFTAHVPHKHFLLNVIMSKFVVSVICYNLYLNVKTTPVLLWFWNIFLFVWKYSCAVEFQCHMWTAFCFHLSLRLNYGQYLCPELYCTVFVIVLYI